MRCMRQLRANLPSAIFSTSNMAPQNAALRLLTPPSTDYRKVFRCSSRQNESIDFRPGRIYIEPADHHLLVEKESALVTKRARRTAIGPESIRCFAQRLAMHGPASVAMLLTVVLDDGTASLIAVRRMQQCHHGPGPEKMPAYPDIPQDALNNLDVTSLRADFGIAGSIDRYAKKATFGKTQAGYTDDIRVEAKNCPNASW